MTPQEAIKLFKSTIDVIENQRTNIFDWNLEQLTEMSQLAINSLEKQIAKKPILVVDNMFNHYECPVCTEIVWKNNHHCVCGQAILWEWEK